MIAVAPFGRGAHDAARPPLPVIAPSDEELAAHRAYLEALNRESKGRCVWVLAAERAAVAQVEPAPVLQ